QSTVTGPLLRSGVSPREARRKGGLTTQRLRETGRKAFLGGRGRKKLARRFWAAVGWAATTGEVQKVVDGQVSVAPACEPPSGLHQSLWLIKQRHPRGFMKEFLMPLIKSRESEDDEPEEEKKPAVDPRDEEEAIRKWRQNWARNGIDIPFDSEDPG